MSTTGPLPFSMHPCVPVGSLKECMAVRMAPWKLTAAHRAVRSCLPSLCAISLVTTNFGIGSERFFGNVHNVFRTCTVMPPWAFIGHPHKPAAESEYDI